MTRTIRPAGLPAIVLYDGLASTPQKVADRAAAEKWVVDQPMADCAGA